MKIPWYTLLLSCCYWLNPAAATAQCTAAAGPEQIITCVHTTIELAGSSNVSTATFAWSGPNGFTSNLPNPGTVLPGQYTLTITDPGTGCTATDEVFILENVAPPAIGPLQAMASCSNDGRIAVDAQVGYSYLWNTGDTIPVLEHAHSGTYCVTVTRNDNGCTAIACDVVQQLDPAIVGDSRSNPLDTLNNGAITLSPMPFGTLLSYQWSGPNNFTSTEPEITNLGPGTYSVTVTNPNSGCTAVYTYQLVRVYPPLHIDWVACGDQTILNILGSTGPYTISWPGGSQSGSSSAQILDLQPGTYSVTITDNSNNTSTVKTIIVPPVSPPCTVIEGTIAYDPDGDCQTESGDPGLGGWIVEAQQGDVSYYGLSDSSGHYQIRVTPGFYWVYPVLKSPLTTICQPHWPANPAQGESDTVNFTVIGPYIDCPGLSVSLGTSVLRRCFDNNFYYLQYCSNSPSPVPGVYIDLRLDSFLQIVSSAKTYTDLGNHSFRFDLDTLAPFECNNFWVRVAVSCDAVLGQTHCSAAHIYPDTLCEPTNPLWSGALVQVAAQCTGDSLHFTLSNTGTAPTSQPLEYIVIEDGMLDLQQSIPPLAPGASVTVSLPANGSTWRIEAAQEPLAPPYFPPVLSVEGCTSTGSFSTGFINQFPTGDSGPRVDEDCTPNVGSYDPNDKQGLPLGYGAGHYIRPGTELDYKIRFQNTGTDTAFNVVIRDTLSEWLDPLSVQPGASSHPYRFELTGQNILIFNFKDILLPDSTANEPLSHGFVQYQVRPRGDVPLETDIPNRAAIYFDFNDPVMTNTTLHRIGEDFVTLGLWQPQGQTFRIRVAPQPLEDASWISVEGLDAAGSFRLSLFDAIGRPLRNIDAATPRFLLRKNELAAGVYFFKIEQQGAPVGSGRLLVR